MGEAEINTNNRTITISSNIITYGNEATEELTERMRKEIEAMWNEPEAFIYLHNDHYKIIFLITAEIKKDITELEVLQNTDPRNNYFRIEKFVHGNISFVDGLGCNTGYFLLENLYDGSTTSAHEYGHTLGLPHPHIMDIRGEGVPSIMYPRGTLVNPEYQYDSTIAAGKKGGTMHPMFRKVKQQDIEDLKLHKLRFENNKAILGDFTNIYHWNHEEMNKNDDITKPPIVG
jgi:hypothetical protein